MYPLHSQNTELKANDGVCKLILYFSILSLRIIFFRHALFIPEGWSLWILFPNTETLCLVAVVDKDMHNTQAIKTAYSVHRKHYSQLETHMCYVYTSIICNPNITLVFGLRQTVSMTALCSNSKSCTTALPLYTSLNAEINLWPLSSVFLPVCYETVTDFLILKQIHSMTDRKTRCTSSFSNYAIKLLNTEVNIRFKNKIQ